MYNLATVIKFEILKQIRKPLFWVAIFIFPLMTLVFGGISYFGATMAEKQSDVAKDELKNNISELIVVDQSEIIDTSLFNNFSVKLLKNSEQGLSKFKASNNPRSALIIYPADITAESIQTFTKLSDNQIDNQQNSMGVASLASSILTASASAKSTPAIAAVLTAKNIAVSSQILDKDGNAYDPTQKMILPGIFLVLLLLIFILTGNQTLVATTEEKENRVAEMILTTIKAKTLIIGKIIALVTLGFIQITVLLLPMVLIYFIGTKLDIIPPLLNSLLSGITFDFWPVFFGVNILVWGFLLMTGFTILVGSLFPTAQDASQFYAPIVLGMMLPLYFAGAIFTGAKTIVISILSFFPLSAPFTLMLRNTAGNLNVHDGLISLVILIISSITIMLLAVRAFRFGVFEYSERLSLKRIMLKRSNVN